MSQNNVVKFPNRLISPIKQFLENELNKLNKTKTSLTAADPFKDEARTSNNSLDDDVDEQLGHMDSQVKIKFLGRQIVQIRKALSRIKLGKFGICEKCGKMIDTDRLAIEPDTTICIACEREREA